MKRRNFMQVLAALVAAPAAAAQGSVDHPLTDFDMKWRGRKVAVVGDETDAFPIDNAADEIFRTRDDKDQIADLICNPPVMVPDDRVVVIHGTSMGKTECYRVRAVRMNNGPIWIEVDDE